MIMQIRRKRPRSQCLHFISTFTSGGTLVYAMMGVVGALLLVLLALRTSLRIHSRSDDTAGAPLLTKSIRRSPNRKRVPIDPQLKQEALSYVRSILSLDRAKALKFFHIPKTAGTAIEYAAGSQQLAWGSCLFNHKPKRDICHYPESSQEWPQYIGWWHIPRQFFPMADTDPYSNSELFGVVRDSYDRMVSEYYYICTLKVLDWRPDQCNRTKLMDANYMNEWLQRKIGSRRNDDKSASSSASAIYLTDNGHFTPQYEFIVGPNQVRMIDHVLRLGDGLNLQFDALMKAYKLSSVKLKKLNALGAEARGSDHLTVDHLDPATLRLIHEIYAQDFDLGYPKRVSRR